MPITMKILTTTMMLFIAFATFGATTISNDRMQQIAKTGAGACGAVVVLIALAAVWAS